MKKRILSILLVVSMLAVMIPVFAVTSSAEEVMEEATVTVTDWNADVITLMNAADFVEFKNQLKTKNFTGKTVKLGADIDLAGCEVTEKGGDKYNVANEVVAGGFQGIFDGQYHSIKNMVMIFNGGNFGVFFGSLDNGASSAGNYVGDTVVIKNFALLDSTISLGNNCALFYRQIRGGSVTIENVYIGTDITFSNATAKDGNSVFVNTCTGSAAFTYTVRNCVYNGTITSAHNYYGVFLCSSFKRTTPTIIMDNCLITDATALPFDRASTNKYSEGYCGEMTVEITTATNVVRYTENGLVDAINGASVDMPAGFVAREGSYAVPATVLPMVENAIDGTNVSTQFKGIQYNESLNAIRFVGLFNGETADFNSVGFEVYAYAPNGNMEKLDLNVNVVYTAITEADGYKTAEQLGADYVYVANLGGIQEGKGIATFVVKTYSVDANNVKTYTDQQTVTFGSIAG